MCAGQAEREEQRDALAEALRCAAQALLELHPSPPSPGEEARPAGGAPAPVTEGAPCCVGRRLRNSLHAGGYEPEGLPILAQGMLTCFFTRCSKTKSPRVVIVEQISLT